MKSIGFRLFSKNYFHRPMLGFRHAIRSGELKFSFYFFEVRGSLPVTFKIVDYWCFNYTCMKIMDREIQFSAIKKYVKHSSKMTANYHAFLPIGFKFCSVRTSKDFEFQRCLYVDSPWRIVI